MTTSHDTETQRERPADPDTAPTHPFSGGIVGTRLLRKEDPRLLTGEAKFTDDLQPVGAVWMALVRSPFAHARIRSIDSAEAAGMPGVVGVFTGKDLAEQWATPMPCAWPVNEDMKNPAHFPLAKDKACYAGDGVAVVVAETRYQAADAAQAVEVDYEDLPAVVSLKEAAADKVIIHESAGTNVAYNWVLNPNPDVVEHAFADAAHVVKADFTQQRLIAAAMEPRAVMVTPEPFGGGMVLYSATQIPHILKIMAAVTLGIPEQKLRVVAPAVGGGFGSKLNVYAEELLALALAKKVGRPVRWTESRSENHMATCHGRGQEQHMELAADEQGKVTGVRVRLLADMGAYMQLVTPGVPLLGSFLYTGVYDVPAMDFECKGVFTTATPTDAYRGAGRPEASYAIERCMDLLAAEVGVDPVEIRKRNFVRKDQFPFTSAGTLVFDSGDYVGAMDKCLAMADYEALRKEQAERRDRGGKVQLGIGVSSYFEICGLAPSRALASLNYGAGGWEAATVRALATGKVQVISGATPHGQGHETSWSMIVADKLGIDPDDVEVLHSDTAISPTGMDTYGSRSLAVGGSAIWSATDKVIAKARTMAAHQLEAAEDDLEFTGGKFSVKGSPGKEVAFGELAYSAFTAHNLPDGMEPGLEAHTTWDPPNFTFPFGTHICVTEVDTETGRVWVRDYFAVDDCGNRINPLIIDGQLHGGIAQGMAQALFEEASFDESGNLLTGTLADYLVPSAPDLPNFTLDHTITPSPSNQMGVKGVGESGTIGAAQAVMNSVHDALGLNGTYEIKMPATPMRVWQAINRDQARNALADAQAGGQPESPATAAEPHAETGGTK